MKFPQINYKPEDEMGSGPVGTDADVESGKVTRKQVSVRDYVAADGTVVKRMEESAGAAYALKGTEHRWLLPVADPRAVLWFANIGFHTKVGNVANTVLNDKDAPGSVDEAAQAISEFLDDVAAGTWAERAAGVGGAKVDRDALAAAIVEVMSAKLGKEIDLLATRQRLDDEPAFFRAMRQVAEITENYVARVGKTSGKTTDDVVSMFT